MVGHFRVEEVVARLLFHVPGRQEGMNVLLNVYL